MNGILEEWVNPSILALTSHRSFASARPFPHALLRDFLIDSQAERLLAALKEEEFVHKESDLFSLSQTGDLVTSNHPTIRSFYLLVRSQEFAEFMQRLTGISVKPGVLDFAGSLYESGDYLLCHDDQVEDRKIAYILYLSKHFEKKDGAEFVLFNNNKGVPSEVAVSYPPLWNSFLFFEVSPLSFHMVGENCSSKKRYAIGGWLH